MNMSPKNDMVICFFVVVLAFWSGRGFPGGPARDRALAGAVDSAGHGRRSAHAAPRSTAAHRAACIRGPPYAIRQGRKTDVDARFFGPDGRILTETSGLQHMAENL